CQPGEDLAILRHVADATPYDPIGALTVDALPGEADVSSAADQAEDRPQRRRLADAVAAEYRGDAGGRNVERDVLDDLLPGDVCGQVVHLQDRFGSGHATSPR